MSVCIPAKTGRAALEELDRVPWHELAHAYGRGIVEEEGRFGSMRWDVATAIRELVDDDEDIHDEALNVLFSAVCHQGTIYEVSPHVVPFLAALAAGDDVPLERAKVALYFIVQVGASGTFVAPNLSHAGSATAEIAKETREAFVASRTHLDALVSRMPESAKLVSALLALREGPDEWAKINALVKAFESN